MENLDANFWNDLYINHDTGWNIGTISTPIKEYIDQLDNKNLRILIPGCGLGHEGRYLHEQGFKNTHLLDFSQEAIDTFQEQNPGFPKENLHVEDFFSHQGEYDLIIEQTLFCALDPSLRQKYSDKTSELLKKGGKLVGLLFNREFEEGPPFGGTKEEYEQYFKPNYSVIRMEECYNSIEKRKGTELFIRMTKY